MVEEKEEGEDRDAQKEGGGEEEEGEDRDGKGGRGGGEPTISVDPRAFAPSSPECKKAAGKGRQAFPVEKHEIRTGSRLSTAYASSLVKTTNTTPLPNQGTRRYSCNVRACAQAGRTGRGLVSAG